MPDGFETEVLAALRELRAGQNELREGQHRIEPALALVRQDLGARIDRLRDDLMVTTTIAAGAEERADGTRTIVRDLLKGQHELRRRVEKLEERDRDRGAGGVTPP